MKNINIDLLEARKKDKIQFNIKKNLFDEKQFQIDNSSQIQINLQFENGTISQSIEQMTLCQKPKVITLFRN